jgi:hypothetical protein
VAGEGASTTTPGVALRLGDRGAVVLLLVLSALPMVLLAVLRLRYALPSGDEPHYLIISQAILEHHDLDVQRVYDSAGYVAFHPVPIEPHTSPGPSGRPLPLHGIGGPVLWLVPFAVAGRAGVMAFMIAVSLATVANVFGLARALGVGLGTSFGVGLAFAVGTPILTYSSLSFVEPIGALVCVWALRLLHQEGLRRRDLLLVSAGLGVLPWVHGRFLLYLPLFLMFLLLRLRRDGAPRGQFVAAVAPAALLVLALEAYVLAVWHTAAPAPNQLNAGAMPFQHDPFPALAGVTLDQQAGFLPQFPIFLLVLPGILLTARRRWRRLHVHVAAAVLPYTLIVCSFLAWDGAWSPPARFLAVVLPLLSGYVALAVQRAPHLLVRPALAAAAGYAGVRTVLAVFGPDHGFTAGAAERAADLPAYLAWAAVAVAVAVGVTWSVTVGMPKGDRSRVEPAH